MNGPIFNPNKPVPAAGPNPSPNISIPAGGPVFHPDEPVPIRHDTAAFVQKSELLHAIFGGSKNQTGVVGESEKFIGVSGDGPVVGVNGTSETGDGVSGTGRRGVVGESDTFQGVFGHSKTGDGVSGTGRRGVVGESDTFQGVFGHSRANAGVVGESEEFDGVFGMSKNATAAGVSGHNAAGGLAGFFEGDVQVTGDIRLTNADCAEDFNIADGDHVEPGTVMVLGDEGALHQSHQPYDKRVAGVISGAGDYKPGIVLDKRQSQHKRQPVALLGKVYCKVDAQYASIEVGDLLTTSATPGHAMKVGEPLQAFGTVIGKALRRFREGQGLIPILIALQ
jgi:hypothetical protein